MRLVKRCRGALRTPFLTTAPCTVVAFGARKKTPFARHFGGAFLPTCLVRHRDPTRGFVTRYAKSFEIVRASFLIFAALFLSSQLAPAATPTLVQHVSSSANPEGVGISGDNFTFTLPNPVGAGNCLVLGISYPSGNTPTVTDNNSNTWPASPAVSADARSGVRVIGHAARVSRGRVAFFFGFERQPGHP